MVMKKFKNYIVALVLCLTLLTQQGCIGSFELVRELHEWNRGVGDKWVQELVFIGLVVIPVYEIALVGDAVIFNLIEFWTGSNPLALKEGEYEEQIVIRDGKRYKLKAGRNYLTVITLSGKEKGRRETLRFSEENMAWNLSDRTGTREVCRLAHNPDSHLAEYVIRLSEGHSVRVAAPASEVAAAHFREALHQATITAH